MDGNAQLQAEIEQLRARLKVLESQKGPKVEGNGAVAQGEGATSVGAGGISIKGGVYIGSEPENATEALGIYRQFVAQTTASLPMRGVDVGASDPTSAQKPISLTNVYVDLDTTSRVNISKQPSALEATISKQSLVLLGVPGGGKSTFISLLAHCLSNHTIDPQGDWLKYLKDWPEDEADLLPVVVILRDFTRSLSEDLPDKAEPSDLWDFIEPRLKLQNLSFAARPILKALENGRVMLLLDGLDEVSTQRQRIFVRDAVRAFISRYPKNRYLLTCRILSYQPPAHPKSPREPQEPDLRLTELPTFELAPFNKEKIDRFIQAWYAELAGLGTIPASEIQPWTQRLQTAVRRPDLWRLASNPMLLTVMALVHTHEGRLPEARALLYEQTVDMLLWRWEQIKVGGKEDASLLHQLLLEADRTVVDLKRTLWELAYQAHVQGAADQSSDALADIGELRLQKALAVLKPGDLNWAMQVVDMIKLRAGLLIERVPEVFTFPHRTFQEYLAGAYLAAQANFAKKVAELALQRAHWREVILLAAGKLVYLSGDMDKPLALVGELCPSSAPESEAGWYQAWLAGDVLCEIGLKRAQDSALGRDLMQRVQSRLVDLVSQGRLAPRERADAGNTLASLGDPRFNPKAWYLPDEPLLGFVEIPSGTFLMGSDPEKDVYAQNDEQPQHELFLPTYYIARYPVTVGQFRAFVQDSGYTPKDKASLQGIPNPPVVGVAWHKAVAYCEWLTKKLCGWEDTPQPLAELLRKQGWRVTLPSEAEWEKAARGADGRIYPWGNKFDPEKANTVETGIGATSAVGCFPAGASQYGVLDMSGNVLEWTRSLWGKGLGKLARYPYKIEAKCENLNAPDDVLRVLRGCSFRGDLRNARCAVRRRDFPFSWLGNNGFRVVVSPAGD